MPCDSLREIDQVSICHALHTDGKVLGVIFVFVSVFMQDMHFGQGEYQFAKPLQSR